MKIRLDLAADVLKAARRAAADEGRSLDEFVERSLRVALLTCRPGSRFRLVTFKGDGLHPDAADARWERLRSMIHEGRGAWPPSTAVP